MARWWELAIPAGCTLAAVALTSWTQARVGRSHRKHEQQLRFYEEKKLAYIRYPELMLEVRNILAPIAKLNRAPYEIDNVNPMLLSGESEEAFSKVREVIRRPKEEVDWQEADRYIKKVKEVTDAVKEAAQKDGARLKQLNEIMDQVLSGLGGISVDVSTSGNIIELYGSPSVRAAARELRQAAGSLASPSDFSKAKEKFMEAARRDLLTS